MTRETLSVEVDEELRKEGRAKNNEAELGLMRDIDDLLLSPETNGDENVDIMNLISVSQKKQSKTDKSMGKSSTARMMGTPDSVQRAIHLRTKLPFGQSEEQEEEDIGTNDDEDLPSPPPFIGANVAGFDFLEEDEEEEEEEKNSSLSRGSQSPPSYEQNSRVGESAQKHKTNNQPISNSQGIESESHSHNIDCPPKSHSLRSFVPGFVWGRSKKDLFGWAVVLLLWTLAIVDPKAFVRPFQGMENLSSFQNSSKSTIPASGDFTEKDKAVEDRKTSKQSETAATGVEADRNQNIDVVIDTALSQGPMLRILEPTTGLELVSSGDVQVKMKVSNLFPEKFRVHKKPRVCLRLSSEHGSTSLGCMALTTDSPQVILKDLQPGLVTLHASLLSEVKKLAKDSLQISVVGSNPNLYVPKRPEVDTKGAQGRSAPSPRARKAEDGETCTTTCTQVCTRSFNLD